MAEHRTALSQGPRVRLRGLYMYQVADAITAIAARTVIARSQRVRPEVVGPVTGSAAKQSSLEASGP